MDEWHDANERSSVGFSDKSGTHIHGVEVGYILLPPANEVCEGYVFTGVCLSTRGGACLVAPWGACVVAGRGMHGCSQGGMHCCCGGACMVAPGVCVVAPGVCVVALGGMHGCSQGACMVASCGGHVWLLWGGMHGCSWGGIRGIRRDTEIQSMSGRYASYWNAFLFAYVFMYIYAFMCFVPRTKTLYIFHSKGPRTEHSKFIISAGGYLETYKNCSRTETITSFRKREDLVPWDLLR